jgi:hypothetical protein
MSVLEKLPSWLTGFFSKHAALEAEEITFANPRYEQSCVKVPVSRLAEIIVPVALVEVNVPKACEDHDMPWDLHDIDDSWRKLADAINYVHRQVQEDPLCKANRNEFLGIQKRIDDIANKIDIISNNNSNDSHQTIELPIDCLPYLSEYGENLLNRACVYLALKEIDPANLPRKVFLHPSASRNAIEYTDFNKIKKHYETILKAIDIFHHPFASGIKVGSFPIPVANS